MKDKLTVAEVNAKLQEAGNKDMEDVVESPFPVDFTGLEPDIEGWDEFVERVVAEGPPEDLEEDDLG